MRGMLRAYLRQCGPITSVRRPPEVRHVRPHNSFEHATPNEYSAAFDEKENRKRKIIR